MRALRQLWQAKSNGTPEYFRRAAANVIAHVCGHSQDVGWQAKAKRNHFSVLNVVTRRFHESSEADTSD